MWRSNDKARCFRSYAIQSGFSVFFSWPKKTTRYEPGQSFRLEFKKIDNTCLYRVFSRFLITMSGAATLLACRVKTGIN